MRKVGEVRAHVTGAEAEIGGTIGTEAVIGEIGAVIGGIGGIGAEIGGIGVLIREIGAMIEKMKKVIGEIGEKMMTMLERVRGVPTANTVIGHVSAHGTYKL